MPTDQNTAAGEAGVPEGWKLVPVELTREMLEACYLHTGVYSLEAYRVMLAAAPPPPANIGADSPSVRVANEARELIAEEKADWADECREYGSDPNCYGAGFHAGMIEGMERILALLATPAEGQGNG